MNIAKLDQILQEFHRRFNHDYYKPVIAGGAVRDALLGEPPVDYDVFILGVDMQYAHEIERYISDLTTVKHVRYDVPSWSCRLLDEKVDVIPTADMSIEHLFDTFDWNVSMFAWDGSLHQRMHHRNIRPGELLVLNEKAAQIHGFSRLGPTNSLRRGFRFADRFGMILDQETIVRLCRMIVEQHDASHGKA
jgi:hypothetical protein